MNNFFSIEVETQVFNLSAVYQLSKTPFGVFSASIKVTPVITQPAVDVLLPGWGRPR